MPDEEETKYKPEIESYYQLQGKRIVDVLFDLGCLSESLSRDGMQKVEDLIALLFQQIADSTSRCANFTKKYKGGPEGERHEEEKRWIQRAKEAEEEGANLYTWGTEVMRFLHEVLSTFPNNDTVLELIKTGQELRIPMPMKSDETEDPTGA